MFCKDNNKLSSLQEYFLSRVKVLLWFFKGDGGDVECLMLNVESTEDRLQITITVYMRTHEMVKKDDKKPYVITRSKQTEQIICNRNL